MSKNCCINFGEGIMVRGVDCGTVCTSWREEISVNPIPEFSFLPIPEEKNGSCLYIHGAGVNGTSTHLLSSYPEYWGDGFSHCTESYFVKLDTLSRGWTDRSLLEEVEASYSGVSAYNHHKKQLLYIYTHSLGNLVFNTLVNKNGIKHNERWITLGAPWKGSEAADFLHSLCNNKYSSLVFDYIATELGYCVDGKPLPVYDTLRTDYPPFKELVVSELTYKSYCGDNAWGYYSRYSLPLYLLAHLAPFPDLETDGMVHISSCLSDELPLNHADLTCRNG